MDRHGLQGAGFLIFLSLSVCIMILISNGAGFDWSSSSLSVVGSSKGSALGVERLQETVSLSRGEMLRRRLLQSDDGSGAYIGYGALSGNSVPCPPQSGRSYYTPNCNSASGAVNPYTRGCSTISKCARD